MSEYGLVNILWSYGVNSFDSPGQVKWIKQLKHGFYAIPGNPVAIEGPWKGKGFPGLKVVSMKAVIRLSSTGNESYDQKSIKWMSFWKSIGQVSSWDSRGQKSIECCRARERERAKCEFRWLTDHKINVNWPGHWKNNGSFQNFMRQWPMMNLIPVKA